MLTMVIHDRRHETVRREAAPLATARQNRIHPSLLARWLSFRPVAATRSLLQREGCDHRKQPEASASKSR
jgi:hypothetical protein